MLIRDSTRMGAEEQPVAMVFKFTARTVVRSGEK